MALFRVVRPRPTPSPALRAAVEVLMWVIAEHRHEFSALARTGTLRTDYEAFRSSLQMQGFRVTGLEAIERARALRALGEYADGRGDLVAAEWFFDHAVRLDPKVGSASRLKAIRSARATFEAPR